ncbi:MAG: TPM domain-containing protein [Bacteroidia bacterium]|nr:TPM domain-containing protein [Bacteroidia bacterium]
MIPAKKFFSAKEKEKIIHCIQKAESQTTAEIRIHIDNICFGNPIERAKKIFMKNNMHVTQHRNGVLFYFAVWSRKLAIIGDEGIYQKVPQEEWDNLVNQLIKSLKNNKDKAETLCGCIEKIGEWLKSYFPVSNHLENPNELSDEISF